MFRIIAVSRPSLFPTATTHGTSIPVSPRSPATIYLVYKQKLTLNLITVLIIAKEMCSLCDILVEVLENVYHARNTNKFARVYYAFVTVCYYLDSTLSYILRFPLILQYRIPH